MCDPTWRDRAACRETSNPDWFFPQEPSHGAPATQLSLESANRVIATYCDRCPVASDCLDEVLRLGERRAADAVGIWGGAWFTGRHTRAELEQIREQALGGRRSPAAGLTGLPARQGDSPPGLRPTDGRPQDRRPPVVTGTGVTRGPDLTTTPYRRPPLADTRPGMRAVDTPALPTAVTATADISDHRRERHAAVRAAVARLTAADATVTWGQVRAWAAASGRWTAADLKFINPAVIDAYLADHATPADRSA